ncbi:MAG: tryptophan--tRNA ligase [Candidatus Micrarchaeota archaeon]|nr:tryptophan--tRNA ligase [Candidatus Micrarchaeota archaeon]
MESEQVVTPWEVTGKVDYDKLIKDFGTKKITPELKKKMDYLAKESHSLIDQEIYFSHRDLDVALADHEAGKGFFLYTGRGPSGEMHIGHIIPLVFTKWLQDKFKCNLYIEITDDEKFMLKKENKMSDIQKIADQNILDIIAVGFDPERTFIFKDSEYIGNMYPLATRVAKAITYSQVKATFGFENSTNIGMIFFPTLEILPTMFENKRCLIPAAIDQDPFFRLQRDLAESLGYKKAAQIYSKFMPPLTGADGKMSSSMPETAIYLSDDAKTVKQKVMKYAFSGGQESIEAHRRLGGNPDIDVSFQWLKYFFEPDAKKLKKIETDYRSGKLLTGELKQILVDKLNEFLANHKERRAEAKEMVDTYMRSGPLAKKMWNTTHK